MEKIETEITIKMTYHQASMLRNACMEASKKNNIEDNVEQWGELAIELKNVIEQ